MGSEICVRNSYVGICTPTPFQRVGIKALSLPASYYDDLSDVYKRRGELLYDGLREVGLDPVKSDGAYYMLTRCPGSADDTEFTRRLAREVGVAIAPGNSFYTKGSADQARFTFPRNEATIREALRRLDENRFW